MVYDQFNGKITDSNASNKFEKTVTNSNYKINRLLVEKVYKTDYRYHESVTKIVGHENEFCDINIRREIFGKKIGIGLSDTFTEQDTKYEILGIVSNYSLKHECYKN